MKHEHGHVTGFSVTIAPFFQKWEYALAACPFIHKISCNEKAAKREVRQWDASMIEMMISEFL
ncbi:hypothetical protein HF072_07790 [Bacillus sp. RO3]|nr:hypothetical protein [Bacillus sp. RO3]